MKFIDKKVESAIHTIVNDQTIRFQIKNKLSLIYKIIPSFSIIMLAILLFTIFWNVSFGYQIDFFSDLLVPILLIGNNLILYGLNIDEDSTFLFIENQIVKLNRISTLIRKNPRFKEIKYKYINFITFKEKKNLLKSIEIYERDDNFPSLSVDTEKAKSELELLEDNLKKFQILFNLKRDIDISKKIINFLIQEASLEKHPVLKNLYFAKI